MSESDAKLGEKARILVRALNDFTGLLAVQAPSDMLIAQVDTLDAAVREVLALCPEEWEHGSTNWTDSIMQNQGKLIELVLAMQSRSS
jgi:hypothetical protein